MKEKKLFDAITEVNDEFVEEALRVSLKKEKKISWKKWTAVAASFLAVLFIASSILQRFPIGGNAGSGGLNEENPHSYMSYAGPVFPIKLAAEDASVTAERNVIYDFGKEGVANTPWNLWVDDQYILQNTSDTEKIITLRYPFVSSFNELERFTPEISVAGEVIETTFYAGGYIGSVSENKKGTGEYLEPNNLSSWEDYKELLENGNYEANAFGEGLELNQNVVIYEFSEFEAPDEYDAATQALSFTIDPKKTNVLTYGFEGAEYEEDGFRRFSFTVLDRDEKKVMIVIGEDISDYTLQGYKNGACESKNELDSVSSVVNRYESTLGEVIENLVDDFMEGYLDGYGLEGMQYLSKETIRKAVSQSLYRYGLQLEYSSDEYQYSMLEDVFSDVAVMKRVMYLEFEVTIPAGECIQVEASMYKEPNYNYGYASKEDAWRYGYDMVTKLGSNLEFTGLTAEILNAVDIEIAGQNYGFDLENGITKVELDLDTEHYYLGINLQEEEDANWAVILDVLFHFIPLFILGLLVIIIVIVVANIFISRKKMQR